MRPPTMVGYRREWWRGDVLAGLAAGTVVIPQAMAYATIAGLPVEIGLYTCMLPMIVYALLGGSRALSVSTTSTIAVLVAATVAGLPAHERVDTASVLRAVYTLTFLVGLFLIAMRLFRLGALVENISPATLTGVRLGVGLTVAASQLPALLGVTADADASGFFAKVGDALRHLDDADPLTVLVSASCLVVLLTLRRFLPQVPAPLLVVAGGILLVATTSAEHHGLALVDHVPTGLPHLVAPVADDIPDLLAGALAIAVMSFLETVLVARTNRRSDEPPIDTDQELLATGIASVAGGLSQTMPPAGGFSQSAVNLRSGAHTQVAQLVTVALAVLVALLLAPVLSDLPRAVLAAMVLVAILGLLDPRELRRYARIDRAELWVAVVVALLGLTGGMLLGVAAGIALTLVLVLRAVNQPHVRPLYRRADGQGWTDVPPGEHAVLQVHGGVLPLRLTGALYTGNARATQDTVLDLVRAAAPPPASVWCDATAVTRVTVPFLDALRELSTQLAASGIGLTLGGVRADVLEVLRRDEWWRAEERHLLAAEQPTTRVR
ncbi:SulP family inorganic anion transporter [Nocardioides sp. CER19]|uniref:SulP family inorganic anion transporter n=1 Tax=Nocardioides sp. CER19 TaxID=3038538 RepID=UPI00244C3B79|nr:SulP family inorganic anion transporter [Nocardioides sp. CER19]MDH2416274.1 SulP family inorganic anion transporter [Nocardioides sp. CER19]